MAVSAKSNIFVSGPNEFNRTIRAWFETSGGQGRNQAAGTRIFSALRINDLLIFLHEAICGTGGKIELEQ